MTYPSLPNIVVEPPGPKSREMFQKSQDYLLMPDTRSFPGLVLKDGNGTMVRDMDGNAFIDFSQSVTTIGRSHPKHLERIKTQLDKVIHQTISSTLCDIYFEFAYELKSIIPPGVGDAHFVHCTTGSEACDIGLNLARRATNRSIVLAYHDSYHGRTGGTLGASLSLTNERKHHVPLISELAFLAYPNCYRCPFGHEYPSCNIFCLKYVETVLETETPPENVAAIIIEPVQSHGGIITPPDEYITGLRALCKQHGILLVLDEVYCGFGKTGKFFAIEHWLDDPDMLCLGKGMGGGLPIAAIVADKEILLAAAPFPNKTGTTGSGGAQTVSSAAAAATIQIMKEENLLDNATKMGEYFRKALVDLSAQHEIIGTINGIGLMLGIELVVDRDTKEPAKGLAKKLTFETFKKGLISVPRGRYKQVIGFTPPLCVTSEQIDSAVEILDSVLRETTT